MEIALSKNKLFGGKYLSSSKTKPFHTPHGEPKKAQTKQNKQKTQQSNQTIKNPKEQIKQTKTIKQMKPQTTTKKSKKNVSIEDFYSALNRSTYTSVNSS